MDQEKRQAEKQADLTPMKQQYYQMKAENPGCLLFFRLGDFYEMFDDDAVLASKELDLTLTTRDRGKPEDERTPMCGVPYHAAESYIGRLIAKGYKVAICEQMEDPALAKGLVKREIIRMVTPGTVMDSSMLDEGRNNYIGGIYMDTRGAGLCLCDISTGECFATELQGAAAAEELESELGRYSPRELLLSDGAYSSAALTAFLKDRLDCHVERAGEWRFVWEGALERCQKQFPDDSPDETHELAVRAAGGLLSYLHETQKNDLSQLRRLGFYARSQYMELDYAARRNLELTASQRTGEKKGSLLWVLDHTHTAMGARTLRQWLEKPLLSVPQIRARQGAVSAMLQNGGARGALEGALHGMLDLERVAGRIVYGTANARDLRALLQVCEALPAARDALGQMPSPLLGRLLETLDPLDDLRALLASAVVDEPPFTVREGNMIRDGFDPEVDRLRELLGGGTARLTAIEQNEREKTGLQKLRVGYNRVFGYYIEVGRAFADQVPDYFIRKQTLANCERYITPELKELEGEVLSASDRLTALEYQVFTGLRERVAAQIVRIQGTAQALAAADALCSLAVAAERWHYVCPEVTEDDVIDVREGRHPVVERVLEDELFVPNDVRLDCGDHRVWVITGPNMAGKSTFMRQVALIVLMAQCGSFVPAETAHIGICDRVFTRIGASDDLFAGRSTFLVEMDEVADILRHATRRSLLILDEIGRGTSTFDGMSIARAVLEYCADRKKLGARTLFATHYHELCALEGSAEGVRNYNVVVKKHGDDIIFIKKIVPGGVSDSYGIEVAKLAGLPDSVIRRAKEVLAQTEKGAPAVLPSLAEKPEEPAEADPQLELSGFAENELLAELRALQPDTLSPIEALNILYRLAKRAKEC